METGICNVDQSRTLEIVDAQAVMQHWEFKIDTFERIC
jgi:hypothetical protein